MSGKPETQLPANWLSVELALIDAELSRWPAGLLDSFHSAYPIIRTPAPDLSKRVAELEAALAEAAQWHEGEANRLKENRRLGIKNYRAGFWIDKHLARAAVIRARFVKDQSHE